MEIIVSDTVAERAQAVANELANQLILQSPTAYGPDEQERQLFINGELDDLQARIIETKDAVKSGERNYCSEACAKGHPTGAGCDHSGCACHG